MINRNVSAASFLSDCAGQFGLAFAAVAVPLVLGLGVAFDYSRLVADNRNLQSSVDAAALAAIAPSKATDVEREAIAAQYMKDNFNGAFSDPTVTVTTDPINRQVVVTAATSIKTSFMNIVGISDAGHSAQATAATKSSNDMCLLALNKTDPKAIKIWGSTSKVSAKCRVQTNSTSSTGLWTDSNSMSVADEFCTSGGYSGTNFSPQPDTGCDAIGDPYALLPTPNTVGCDYSNMKVSSGTATLYPGKYCGGLSIGGADVAFKPGLYVIKDGGFKIAANATVFGEGVTFYLYGTGAVMEFKGGPNVELSAPKTGDFLGMLVIQDRNSNPGGTSRLTGETSTKLTGALYFPTQTLATGGTSGFGTASTFMSVVADKFEMFGNGSITLSNDHEAAGYGDMVLPGTPVPYLLQ